MLMNVFATGGSGNATPFRPEPGQREPGGPTRNSNVRSGRTGITRNSRRTTGRITPTRNA